MGKTALIALGGNAIIKAGQVGTAKEQFENTFAALDGIVKLIEQGYKLVITHGNGPQVGNLLRQQELGASSGISPLPLGLLNAATEGTMGYMIEQSLQNRLFSRGISKEVLCVITQVEVAADDPSFQNPSKYVGSRYYSQVEAETLQKEAGWTLKEDSGKGYRRVVPSPLPQRIVPAKSIVQLLELGKIVIAAGGGGIPVCKNAAGMYQGIDAVIDKDFASALLAREIGADLFVILTGVDKVALNYGTKMESSLDCLSVQDAIRYYQEGQFPAGSMGPKILAAVDYLQNGGKKVVITSLEKVEEAVEGLGGTRIV